MRAPQDVGSHKGCACPLGTDPSGATLVAAPVAHHFNQDGFCRERRLRRFRRSGGWSGASSGAGKSGASSASSKGSIAQRRSTTDVTSSSIAMRCCAPERDSRARSAASAKELRRLKASRIRRSLCSWPKRLAYCSTACRSSTSSPRAEGHAPDSQGDAAPQKLFAAQPPAVARLLHGVAQQPDALAVVAREPRLLLLGELIHKCSPLHSTAWDEKRAGTQGTKKTARQ